VCTGNRCPLIAVAIWCALLVAGHAQTLETTIYLPDSAGGVTRPAAVVYNPNDNCFYVGGWYGGVSVYSAATGAGVTHFRVGYLHVQALCLNPATNRLYVAEGTQGGQVIVVDCATNATLAEIAVGVHPRALVYHPVQNWLYCANDDDTTVTIIDCAGDTVVTTVAVGKNPRALCYNPVNQKVYCANSESNTVTVMDSANPRLTMSVDVGNGPEALVCNPVDNRVFCANTGDVTVSVLRGSSNYVWNTVPTGDEPIALCYNSAANTVFCANYHSDNVAVIDGKGERVVAMMVVPANPGALAFDAADDRVFCTSTETDTVTVLDGADNSVLGYIALDAPQDGIYYSSPDNRLAAIADEESWLSVIDCGSSAVVAARPTGAFPYALALSPDGRKLYSATSARYAHIGILSVIDVPARKVVANLPVGRYPRALCCNTQNHKVYCLNNGSETVTIIDADADTILATVAVDGAEAICYAPAANRVYAAGGYYAGAVTAIDGVGDSVVARFVTLAGGSQLCTNVAGTRLYVAGEPSYVTVVDCASNSVVADIPVGDNVGGLLYNSVSGKVYACEYVSGRLDIIDAATNSVIDTLQVGNSSERMCYSPLNGNVFVGVRLSRKIRVVDGFGDTLLATRPFAGYLNDVAYEPVYDRVYTCYYDEPFSAVTMIDANTYNTVGSVEVLGTPERILAHPADSTVYVTFFDGAGIYVIGAVAGAVAEPRAALPAGDRPASTMVRGVLFMPERTGSSPSASLLDISGRRVMDLQPGANDVRALAPGVYFVRTAQAQAQAQAVRKVVLTE